MAVLGELLFHRRDGVGLDDVLRHQGEQGVRDAVDGLPDTVFSSESDDALTGRLVKQLSIEPLKLLLDQAKAEVKEITLEIQDVFHERARVKGLRATKAIPFTGDPNLWAFRPNPYDFNPPYGQVSGQKVILGMDVREHDAEQAASHIKHAIATIEKYIKTQEVEINTFNSGLAAKVLPQIQLRRARLGKATDLLKKLQAD